METFTKLFGSWLLFVHHCFDRVVIHGYLSGLSRPGQVVHFFQQVVGEPVVGKEVRQLLNKYRADKFGHGARRANPGRRRFMCTTIVNCTCVRRIPPYRLERLLRTGFTVSYARPSTDSSSVSRLRRPRGRCASSVRLLAGMSEDRVSSSTPEKCQLLPARPTLYAPAAGALFHTTDAAAQCPTGPEGC
jgi:hypothetical protein